MSRVDVSTAGLACLSRPPADLSTQPYGEKLLARHASDGSAAPAKLRRKL
jgi:hypothetical protein